MTFRGHVKNGQIQLDEPIQLPEGAKVNIVVVENDTAGPNLWDKLRRIAGTVEGPADWAENHDHYAHGAPKRS